MITIKYKAKSFPKTIYGKKLQGVNTLQIDWHDLIWSAITVGKRNNAQITKNGIFSVYEIINRASLIWSSLKVESGHLSKTDIYVEMDPTEKVFVSFSIGMTISKLFSSKLLNTPWLEHVANIDQRIRVNKRTKSRPDLIGLNSRKEFIIVEAKGRTSKYSNTAQKKAKEQAKVISNIAGTMPVLRVASQSYFTDHLEVYFEDPEEVVEKPLEIITDVNSYFKSYYGLFKNLSEKDLLLLKPMGIDLAFSKSLKNAFETDNYSDIFFEKENNYIDEAGFKVFPDGIKLKLNPELWGEQKLKLNPSER
jgi:hypothetical protein